MILSYYLAFINKSLDTLQHFSTLKEVDETNKSKKKYVKDQKRPIFSPRPQDKGKNKNLSSFFKFIIDRTAFCSFFSQFIIEIKH